MCYVFYPCCLKAKLVSANSSEMVQFFISLIISNSYYRNEHVRSQKLCGKQSSTKALCELSLRQSTLSCNITFSTSLVVFYDEQGARNSKVPAAKCLFQIAVEMKKKAFVVAVCAGQLFSCEAMQCRLSRNRRGHWAQIHFFCLEL